MKKMKKVVMIMLLGCVLMILGCKPEVWDVNKHSGWKLWGEGVLTSKVIEKNPKSPNQRVFILQIDDKGIKTKFMIANLKDAPLVKIGQKGLLYKYNSNCEDDSTGAYFQWIPDFGYVPEPLPVKVVITKENATVNVISTPDTLINTPVPASVSKWKSVNVKSPTINTTVLVKLKSGIFTTAYMLSNGYWKYDLYRNKTGGGSTTFDIVEWKKIDLE